MRLIIFIAFLTSLISCRVNRSFLPGQEGMETVYKEKQWKAGLDMVAGNGVLAHGSVNYSPVKNLGILFDSRLGSNSQSHTLAAGFYKGSYSNEIIKDFNDKDIDITTGKHWDVYGGANYLNTQNSFVTLGFNDGIFNVNVPTEIFEISWVGMRYFAQAGMHIKSHHIGIDAVLRQSWLQANKVNIYGLSSLSNLTPEEDLRSKNPRRYTEIGFKMNFGKHYTPFYCGFTTRLGKDTKFTNAIYAHSLIFIGANLRIASLLKKS